MQREAHLGAAPLLLLIGTCLLAGPVAADSGNPQALYEEAKRDLDEARYPFALEKFRRALPLARGDEQQTWRLLLGVALTFEQMEQTENAVEYYRRFLRSVAEHAGTLDARWETRRRLVEDQVVGLENVLLETSALLSIESVPEGARVRVDGLDQGADGDARTPVSLYLAPGEHRVRLEQAGFQPEESTLRLRAGAREVLRVSFSIAGEPAVPPPVAVGKAPSPPPVEPEVVLPGRPGRAPLWGWLGVGTGAALLGSGVLCTVLASAAHTDLVGLEGRFEPERWSDAAYRMDYQGEWDGLNATMTTRQIVAGVLYGLGGAMVAGSAVYLLFFVEPERPGISRALPVVTPFAAGGGGGLLGAWRW